MAVWNFRGEMVTKFADHALYHPDTSTNNIVITTSQATRSDVAHH